MFKLFTPSPLKPNQNFPKKFYVLEKKNKLNDVKRSGRKQ